MTAHPCTKIRFPSRRHAWKAQEELRDKGDRSIEIYECRRCHNWHLGHPSKKESA